MSTTAKILLSAALLACFSCDEPRKRNVVDVRPGAPLFPTMPGGSQPGQAGAANINPPHGQPGHNCAVPVGAPLPAATAPPLQARPGADPAAPTLSPGAQAPLPPVSVPVQVAPGTNPPHGQPGHDCSIPVGAPLSTR